MSRKSPGHVRGPVPELSNYKNLTTELQRFVNSNVANPQHALNTLAARPADPEPQTMGQGLSGIMASAGAPRPQSSVSHEFMHDYSTGPQTVLAHSHANSPAPAVATGEPQPYVRAGDSTLQRVFVQPAGAPKPLAAGDEIV